MKFAEEPFIDTGHLPDLVHRVATMECCCNRKDTLVGWIDKLLVDIIHEIVLGNYVSLKQEWVYSANSQHKSLKIDHQ